jgi:uncharacterized protein with HEPN domain
MQPTSKKYLADAQGSVEAIEEFVRGRSLADMAADKMFRSASYFEFAVIGEAFARMRDTDAATFERFTDCHRIVGFRNRVLHGYGNIQDNVTWQIIQDKLPVLKKELAQLLLE